MAQANFFTARKPDIESTLDRLLRDSSSSDLIAAARYSTLSEAKRLRPLIALAIGEHYGRATDELLPPAAAIELLHTYTLIHDDLPCMDDETERRNQPPLHRVYPEGHAVLTGDFLLTYAFQVIGEAPGLTSEERAELTLTLAKRAGGQGVIGGQVIDIAPEEITSFEALEEMYKRKTSDLFTVACEFGAILGGASVAERNKLTQFGKLFGLAFQFLDDFDDHEGEPDKTTALSLLGLDGAAQKLQEYLVQLEGLTCGITPLASLVKVLENKS